MAYEVQRSFAAGELDPKSWLRNDLAPLHSQAVKRMENVIADPHGPAISRNGFEFIQEIEGETYCRLFDFDVSFAESYTVVVTPSLIYILDRNGFHLSSNFISNGNFSNGSTDWISERTTFVGGVALMESGAAGQNAYIRQQITVDNPLNMHLFRIDSIIEHGNTEIIFKLGTTIGGDDIYSETIVSSDYQINLIPGEAIFWVEIELDLPNAIRNVDSITVSEIIGSADYVTFPSPYTAEDISELQTDKKPGNRSMYFFTRRVAPQELEYVATHTWEFKEIDFVFGDDGAPWEDEFPGCVTFHDGRMFVGGTYSKPVHIWGSKPGEYTSFDLGTGAADDALELPLDKHGELHWLKSNTQLFAGLDTGEHILFGNGGPLAPDNAQTEQQSTYGSARIHSFIIDERVAYVDTSRRIIRVMDYSDEAKAYRSSNITFQAEHVTEGKINEIRYGISPRGLIYCVTATGDLVVASLENDQGTLGWHRHDTQGRIISISISKEFGQDIPYIAVVRNGRLFIERYDSNGLNYSDSFKVVEEVIADTHFEGFEHLAEQTVQVIADGKVHPDIVVGLDGTIDLEYPANIVSVGLGFTALIETLPNQNDLQSGNNTLNYTKRFTELFVYLQDSPRPLINGFDPYLRFSPTPMGEREQNETGILSVSTDVGWDKEATIIVSQELALPMVIQAIGGRLKENKV